MENKKWFVYRIDYEYGIADLFCREQQERPITVFNNLAGECFGIRKSIGETKLLDEQLVDVSEGKFLPPKLGWVEKSRRHPDIYNHPIQRIVESMPAREITLKPEIFEKANFILAHDGGDVIVWADASKPEEKLKSEGEE